MGIDSRSLQGEIPRERKDLVIEGMKLLRFLQDVFSILAIWSGKIKKAKKYNILHKKTDNNHATGVHTTPPLT